MPPSGHHVTVVGHCKNLPVPPSGHHVTLVGHCKNLTVPPSGHHCALAVPWRVLVILLAVSWSYL